MSAIRAFAKISTSIWHSRKFRLLGDREKLLYLYLHTCPHANAIGCFVVPPGYMAADLGWDRKTSDSPMDSPMDRSIDSPMDSPIDRSIHSPADGLRKALARLCEVGLIEWDEAEDQVRIVGFLHHTPLTNAKHAAGAARDAARLPQNRVTLNLVKDLRADPWGAKMQLLIDIEDRLTRVIDSTIHSPIDSPIDRPAIALPKGYGYNENENKNENLPPPTSSATPPPAGAAATPKSAAGGTRLPADWTLTDDLRAAAVAACERRKVPLPDLDRVAVDFADYWHAKAGPNARKADWRLAWLTWVRTEGDRLAERVTGRHGTPPAAPAHHPEGKVYDPGTMQDVDAIYGRGSAEWINKIRLKLWKLGRKEDENAVRLALYDGPKAVYTAALAYAEALDMPPPVA